MKKTSIFKGLIALLLLASFGSCVGDDRPQEEDIKKEINKDKPNENTDDNQGTEDKDDDGTTDDGTTDDGTTDDGTSDDDTTDDGTTDGGTTDDGTSDDGTTDDDTTDDGTSDDGTTDDGTTDDGTTDDTTDDTSDDDQGGGNNDLVYAKPAKRSPMFTLEFTGQYCINCPKGLRHLAEMEDRFGKENYIYVGMHSEKKFSILGSQYRSLYNAEADQYGQDVEKIPGLPFVWINSLGVTSDDKSLQEIQNEPDLLKCDAKALLTPQGEVEVDFKTFLREDMKDYAKSKKIDVLIWILEDDVEALQYGYNTASYWKMIKHHHLFRSNLNGHWGESYKIGSSYKKTFPVPENILEKKNCEIILLFLDNSNRFVLDAKRCKLKV